MGFNFFAKKKTQSTPHKTETVSKPQYTTTLTIQPQFRGPLSSIIHCKDGGIYIPSGTKIGSYRNADDGKWTVFCDEDYEIGHFYEKSDAIYFNLHGKVQEIPHLHARVANSPKGWLWCVAERADVVNAIIDRDTCDPIAFFQGNSLEAAAAFICWAHDSYDNKYSDFFDMR